MSGTTTTYDKDQSATISSVGGVITALVTHDSGTPVGEIPTVSLTVDLSVLGSVDVVSESGAVADITNIVGALGQLDVRADGGTVNLEPASVGLLSGTVIDIENGGTATASGTFLGLLDSSAIAFGPGTGVLNFNSNGNLLDLGFVSPISGFSQGDTIVDQDALLASVGSYTLSNPLLSSNQTITFFSGTNGHGTNLGTFTFAAGTFSGSNGTFNKGSGPLQLIAGPGGTLEIAVCFLSGTHIQTENGETLVENLQVGDFVAVLRDTEIVFKPVKWIGYRTLISSDCTAREAFPIRIRHGAFADNIPIRDLLVTPDHCVFIQGKLIPARMLVNSGSIIIDRSINAYTYYHVELDEHSVILAEGLATESYLDTGNRGNFSNAPVTLMRANPALSSCPKVQRGDARIPLAVDRQFVEPIWQSLLERSVATGWQHEALGGSLTNDPGLILLIEGGFAIEPIVLEEETYSFLVPAGAKHLRLASRAARPSDIIGSFVDDRRKLGVRVGRINLSTGSTCLSIDEHLQSRTLQGWHSLEAEAAGRWTDGDAVLPIDLSNLRGRAVLLDIQVLQAGPYVEFTEHADVSFTIAA